MPFSPLITITIIGNFHSFLFLSYQFNILLHPHTFQAYPLLYLYKVSIILSILPSLLLKKLCSFNMNSLSQGLVLTTATVLSCALFYLAFSSKIISPPSFISGNSNSQESKKQILRSCLCSEERKVERKEKKKRKKVKFADNVKEAIDGREKGERKKQYIASRSCRDEMEEIMGMQANRVALYNGILRDRARKIQCS